MTHGSDRRLTDSLRAADPEVAALLELELSEQSSRVYLLAASSILDASIRAATDSPLTNIDSEGHPPALAALTRMPVCKATPVLRRSYHDGGPWKYNGGTFVACLVERLACNRAASLFCTSTTPALYANVQPATGSIAVLAALRAVLEPGEPFLALKLKAGGHLTHGATMNLSGQAFEPHFYGLSSDEIDLDYDEVDRLVESVRPRAIVAGFSSFPRAVDWARLAASCRRSDRPCVLVADLSHIAGLVAAGCFPSPFPHADIAVLATYKTLLGPRGAVILSRSPELSHAIDRSVFPGLQSAPLAAQIAGIAVCLRRAGTSGFRSLQARILANSRQLAKALVDCEMTVAFGGTDCHYCMADFRTVTGVDVGRLAQTLEMAGIVCNPNILLGSGRGQHFAGLRLGTVWPSQQGMGPAEMTEIADLVAQVVHAFLGSGPPSRTNDSIDSVIHSTRERTRELACRFPYEDVTFDL